jgi:glycosyltransferase involved in cell wall biosynthesis
MSTKKVSAGAAEASLRGRPSRREAWFGRVLERRGPAATNTGLFVVWRAYQGRVDAMQRYFDYRPHYLGFSFSRRVLRPLEYVAKAVLTWLQLRRTRPAVVWLQMPPTFKLYLLAAYKHRHRDVKLVADCHNILLESPWINTPGLRSLLSSSADVVLFHNSVVYGRALEAGFPPDRTMILETRPATLYEDEEVDDITYPRPWALLPASFKEDEPIDAVLDAAKSLAHVTFIITGDPRKARRTLESLPGNVVLEGWVDARRFKSLLAQADVVLGLTRLEGVLVSVASEAVGFGRAMVLSDTRLLREVYGDAAVYTHPTASALSEGVANALSQRAELERRSRLLRGQRLERWKGQAEEIACRLV